MQRTVGLESLDGGHAEELSAGEDEVVRDLRAKRRCGFQRFTPTGTLGLWDGITFAGGQGMDGSR